MQNVIIEADLPTIVPHAVSFETGASRAQVSQPEHMVYDHHGEEFGWADPGALTSFYDDVMHGRQLPTTFATRALRDVDTLVAITLFKHPEISTLNSTLNMVSAADLVHRRGVVGAAHVDRDLSRFFNFLRGQFHSRLTSTEFEQRLENAVDHIHENIVNGALPHLGGDSDPPRVIDRGTGGFVVAETRGSLSDGWEHLFRGGFLRGVLFGPEHDGRRHVLVGKKGPFVPLHLEMAARLLNEMERAMGELPEWKAAGFWLQSPSDGTLILVSHVLEVLVRV